MRASAFFNQLQQQIDEVKAEGLYKSERVITSQQQAQIEVASGDKVINFCANNYLGLANSPELIKAAQQGLDDHGFGVASVRFICGTQDIHKTLEEKISAFLETEDTILYSSCFDANAGLFETILGPDDAIISDALNHASIIDGVRLCKAKRFRYANNDMSDLEKQLIAADEAGAKTKLIATDGVFSMDGVICNLEAVCDLADKYDALVMVDDSHATGFLGESGRGTAEVFGVVDKVDIVTSTLGKTLGGASGGFTTGKSEIIEYLRQRSRPYLFSNTIAPPIVLGAIKAFEILTNNPNLRHTLWSNTEYFRNSINSLGFDVIDGIHPIVPIMVRDEIKTVKLADEINKEGIFVVGFSFPVVPRGEARIRVQISAAHTKQHLDKALSVFEQKGKALDII